MINVLRKNKIIKIKGCGVGLGGGGGVPKNEGGGTKDENISNFRTLTMRRYDVKSHLLQPHGSRKRERGWGGGGGEQKVKRHRR